MNMGPTLYLACDAQDYDVSTGQCAQPYYAMPPSFLPYLSYAEGAAVAGAIAGVWAVGVVARMFIRTADYAR